MMAFPAAAIEVCRLQSIAWAWRMIGATRAPINAPSEWDGWTVINPDLKRQQTAESDSRKRAERHAGGICARCGRAPAAEGRRACARCMRMMRARSRESRERRRAVAG